MPLVRGPRSAVAGSGIECDGVLKAIREAIGDPEREGDCVLIRVSPRVVPFIPVLPVEIVDRWVVKLLGKLKIVESGLGVS